MKGAGFLIALLFSFGVAALTAQDLPPLAQQIRSQSFSNDTLLLREDASYSVTQERDSLETIVGNRPVMEGDTLFIDRFSDSFFAPAHLFKPTPRKAVIYSALFPGMGQVYNRKYWKLPILYGGFVGFTYAITWNNGLYRDYLVGYQHIMDSNPETNRWHDLLPYGRDPGSVDEKWFTDVLQKRKDYYRYYRDLSIIGTVALYMLAMVDAYVDAQLFDFDMSPDLSMRVQPAVVREQQTGLAAVSSYGLQLCFTF